MIRTFWLLLLTIILAMGYPTRVLALGFYTSGAQGFDISYPQKTGLYPIAPFGFGIAGVTNGRAYTGNPYLAGQFIWAKNGAGSPSLYMNLNAPVGSTVKGNTATPNPCPKSDKVCQAYNYGYNAAAYSFIYAQGQNATSSMWWLDIETGNSWSPNVAINDATIQGAIDYLNQQGVTVGIYSTQSMWNTIAGSSFIGTVANWVAGAAATNYQSFCSLPFTANGKVWLVQYPSSGFNADYACP